MYKLPKVITEIGCNHRGEFETALLLIEEAKRCGAQVAKFQKRNNRELLTKEQYNSPHPNLQNSYGDTYGAHREFLEFSVVQHKQLKEYCEKIGIEYSTSVWDSTSAKEIIALNPAFLKVPSACNNNFKMLEILRDMYAGDIHISVGMTLDSEIDDVISFFEKTNNAKERIILYSCTSGYPVAFEDVCLLEISKLKEKYGNRVKDIGFSGHHLGIAVDIAAYTLGANWIERHFTMDRTWKGTDHAASLEPEGMRKLCRNLKATYLALQYKKQPILSVEQVQRNKLKYKKS